MRNVKEDFDKKINYFKHKILLNKEHIDMRIELINKYARIYKIDCNELYGISLLEHINRGRCTIKILEKIAIKFFVHKAIKLDLSIGIAQIKISTARQFYPDCNIKKLSRKLLTEEFNIHLCAQIISEYYSLPDKNNMLLGLVKTIDNPSITLYYLFLKWIKKESLISK